MIRSIKFKDIIINAVVNKSDIFTPYKNYMDMHTYTKLSDNEVFELYLSFTTLDSDSMRYNIRTLVLLWSMYIRPASLILKYGSQKDYDIFVAVMADHHINTYTLPNPITNKTFECTKHQYYSLDYLYNNSDKSIIQLFSIERIDELLSSPDMVDRLINILHCDVCGLLTRDEILFIDRLPNDLFIKFIFMRCETNVPYHWIMKLMEASDPLFNDRQPIYNMHVIRYFINLILDLEYLCDEASLDKLYKTEDGFDILMSDLRTAFSIVSNDTYKFTNQDKKFYVITYDIFHSYIIDEYTKEEEGIIDEKIHRWYDKYNIKQGEKAKIIRE